MVLHQKQKIYHMNININISLCSDANDKNISTSIFFVCWLKVLYFGVFTLVLNTVFWDFSATVSTFWVTAVALATWCNAQILLDSPCFRFAKLKRLDETVKKIICIFGARNMFAVYVEASIGICCFIPAHHRIRYSFRFFALSVERPLCWQR